MTKTTRDKAKKWLKDHGKNDLHECTREELHEMFMAIGYIDPKPKTKRKKDIRR